MSLYRIETSQELPITLDQAWEFFSVPGNLSYITPSRIHFEITNSVEEKMYAGQIITYSFYPFGIWKSQWVSEITHVSDKSYFIDEQKLGPFKYWRHKHSFKATDGGVIVEDELYYKLPFGFLGRIVHSLFVAKKIDKVFKFRQEQLRQLFRG
jgi:ligand-binding SRPBCC domain-containing protein